MMIEITMPITAREKVKGKRSRMSWVTGWPEVIDSPKSRRTMSASQLKYWIIRGRSVPSWARIAAMSSSVASIPAITRAGSPGITRIMKNIMVEISSTVSSSLPMRFKANDRNSMCKLL